MPSRDLSPRPTKEHPLPNEKNSQHPESASPAPAGGLTFRAVLLALIVGVIGSVAANYHDGIILHADVSQQNYVAPLAMALIFCFIVLINSFSNRFCPRFALRGAELGIALALAVIATPISRYFAAGWVHTIGYTRSLIDSQNAEVTPLVKVNLLEALPEGAVLGSDDSRTFDDGVMKRVGAMANVTDIPWRVWLRPALFWAPPLLCFLVLCVSLGRLLYRQWAERELVSFPLAEMAADLLRHERRRHFPDIFYVRSFWYGFGAMVVVFLVNGIHAHVPKMIEIPTKFQFYELVSQFPFLKNSLEGYSLLRGWTFFAVIAAAVLLPSEISFTSWFTWPIMVCCTYFFYVQTGQPFGKLENNMMMTGSFWAMAALILYTGRVFYLAVFLRALGLKSKAAAPGGLDEQSVGVCRVFLLAVFGFIAILAVYGIPLDLAIIWTLALLMLFLVVCRLVAEMGIPWTPLSNVGPLPLMLAVLGEKALGAKAYALFAIFNSLTMNTTVFIPPAVANAAHIESRLTGRLASARILTPFLAIMLTACVATAIWMGYSSEGDANDYPTRGLATVNTAATTINNLYLRGDNPPALRDLMANNAPFRERWAAVRVDPRFPPLFAAGAALVLLTGLARLRFPWFPLHPLPLVLLGSWVMSRYCFSFFLGWLIKAAILKIGGGRLFEKTRPFFVGVLTGLAVIFTFWVGINIVLFRNNHFSAEAEWSIIFRDLFSS